MSSTEGQTSQESKCSNKRRLLCVEGWDLCTLVFVVAWLRSCVLMALYRAYRILSTCVKYLLTCQGFVSYNAWSGIADVFTTMLVVHMRVACAVHVYSLTSHDSLCIALEYPSSAAVAGLLDLHLHRFIMHAYCMLLGFTP